MAVLISTIIPTIGRETLTRAVKSVLDQQLTSAEFEVIVVNDSGVTLPVASWHNAPALQITKSAHR